MCAIVHIDMFAKEKNHTCSLSAESAFILVESNQRLHPGQEGSPITSYGSDCALWSMWGTWGDYLSCIIRMYMGKDILEWTQNYIKCQDIEFASQILGNGLDRQQIALELQISMILCGCWAVWQERNAQKHGEGKVAVMLPIRYGGCCRPPWTLPSQVERSQKGIQRRRCVGNHLMNAC
jgi:hypothetical protein